MYSTVGTFMIKVWLYFAIMEVKGIIIWNGEENKKKENNNGNGNDNENDSKRDHHHQNDHHDYV